MSAILSERDERVEAAFNELNIDSIDSLDNFYASDVEFEDPLGRIEGLDELKAYYAKLYQNVTEIHFEFHDHVSDGDMHVGIWTMRMKAENLNGGEEVQVDGTSMLIFNDDGLVEHHRDYFDMGQMIYQHVPILRWLVKKVNDRLAHDSEG